MKDIYYVAFLRGINVGGNSMVKMLDLKTLFEKLKFGNVKTVLNSGNVVFTVSKKELSKSLENKIEKELRVKYKKDIAVMVKSGEEILKMIKKDPFKKVKVTKSIRRYVTFIKDSKKDIYTVFDLDSKTDTVKMMAEVGKKCGDKITTRNWNTIEKISKLVLK